MTNEFISPNWHTLLIHFPIGLLILGVLIEIISFGWPRGSFRAAGRWMLLLGTLLAIPAATGGIYAFRDVVTPEPVVVGPHWQQIVQQSHWSDAQWEFMADHIWFNSFAAVLFVAAVVFWLAGSDNWRRTARIPLLFMVLVGAGLLVAGAWHGGELVYRFGTGVAASDAPAAPAVRSVQYYIPSLQLHLVVAGFAAAFVVAAFALTIRRWQLDAMALVLREGERRPVAPAVTPEGEAVSRAERVELRSAGPYGEERAALAGPPRVFPGWFWLGAFAIAIGAAAAGAWSLLGQFTRQAFEQNWEELQEADHRRLLLHVVFGVSIIVLSLILSGLVRFARRWRALAGILGSLVVLLIAGQVWLGTLMTFDGHSGPLIGFAAQAAAPQAYPTHPREEPRAGQPAAPQTPREGAPAAPPAGPAQPPPQAAPPPAPAPEPPVAPQEPPPAPAVPEQSAPAPQQPQGEPAPSTHEEIGA